MAATAVASNLNRNNTNFGVGLGAASNGNLQRGFFGNQVPTAETARVRGGDNNGTGNFRDNTGLGVRMRTGGTTDRQRELSGDEIEEIEMDGQPPSRRVKVAEDNWEVPATYYGQIVGMLEGFRTKGTIWYSNPDAEKKRDKSAFVLWKGRTKNDGSMILSIMEASGVVREVVATEVSIAQQFKDIFDSNSASRIFELVGTGTNIQKAVFQTLSEQAESGGGSD